MQSKYVRYLGFTARVLSLLSFGFVAFFLVAHIFGEETVSFNSAREVFLFAFFPCGFLLGLLVAWKSELVGSLISIGSIMMLYVLGMQFRFDPVILALAMPALLFLIHYLLRKHESGQVSAE